MYTTKNRFTSSFPEIYMEHTDLNLCCALFACVGVGYLFPFSALTQPVDYWKKVFPDHNIEFPLVTLYMWTNLICLFVVVFCVKRYLSNMKYESELTIISNNIMMLWSANHHTRSDW